MILNLREEITLTYYKSNNGLSWVYRNRKAHLDLILLLNYTAIYIRLQDY